MPAGALPYQSDGDIIFYRAREATASVSPQRRVCALVGARTIRFSGMAGSVVHLLEQPRPGCDRVLPHSPEPSRGAGRADRNLKSHGAPTGGVTLRDAGQESLRVFGCLPVTARGAARRQASEKPRRRKPRGEYAPAAVSVYGDLRPGSARLGRSRTELPA